MVTKCKYCFAPVLSVKTPAFGRLILIDYDDKFIKDKILDKSKHIPHRLTCLQISLQKRKK